MTNCEPCTHSMKYTGEGRHARKLSIKKKNFSYYSLKIDISLAMIGPRPISKVFYRGLHRPIYHIQI